MRHFSDLQGEINQRGAGVSVEHYNAQGKLPICTVYWRRMIFKNREQPIVARGNDWWQVSSSNAIGNTPGTDKRA